MSFAFKKALSFLGQMDQWKMNHFVQDRYLNAKLSSTFAEWEKPVLHGFKKFRESDEKETLK